MEVKDIVQAILTNNPYVIFVVIVYAVVIPFMKFLYGTWQDMRTAKKKNIEAFIVSFGEYISSRGGGGELIANYSLEQAFFYCYRKKISHLEIVGLMSRGNPSKSIERYLKAASFLRVKKVLGKYKFCFVSKVTRLRIEAFGVKVKFYRYSFILSAIYFSLGVLTSIFPLVMSSSVLELHPPLRGFAVLFIIIIPLIALSTLIELSRFRSALKFMAPRVVRRR